MLKAILLLANVFEFKCFVIHWIYSLNFYSHLTLFYIGYLTNLFNMGKSKDAPSPYLISQQKFMGTLRLAWGL